MAGDQIWHRRHSRAGACDSERLQQQLVVKQQHHHHVAVGVAVGVAVIIANVQRDLVPAE